MPIRLRDYHCDKCEFEFTYLASTESSDEVDEPKKCPKCGTKKLRQLFPYVHVKNSNPPWSPRHRRGQMGTKPVRNSLPLFSKDDLKAKRKPKNETESEK